MKTQERGIGFMKIVIIFSIMSLIQSKSLGQYKWQKSLGNNGYSYSGKSVITNSGIVIFASSDQNVGFNKTQNGFGLIDYWIVKIDTLGNKIWDKTFGGSSNDFNDNEGLAPQSVYGEIIETKDKGFLLGGTSSSNTNGNKSAPVYGFLDLWVIKLDSNGNKIWDKSFGGSRNESSATIFETENGFLIGCSSSSDSGTGNKISNNKPSTLQSHWDFWLLKLDLNGDIIWQKSYGGSEDDILTKIIQINKNKYILTGTCGSNISGDVSQSSIGGSDYWFICIDSNGNKIWDKRFGGNQTEVMKSSFYMNNIIYSTGTSISSQNGDVSKINNGNVDCWILAIDANGNKIWDNLFGGNFDDKPYDLSGNQKNLYIGLNSNSNSIGSKSENNRGFEDFWIMKIDSSGKKLWDKTIGGDQYEVITSIQLLKDGSILTIGNSNSDISGDRIVARKGNKDILMVNLKDIRSKVQGRVFPDFNANCIYNKPSEYNIPNILVHNKVENTYAMTGDSIYTMYLFDRDTAILQVVNLDTNLYISCSKDSIFLDLTGKGDTSDIDFPIRTNVTGYCIKINGHCHSRLRPGMWSNYQLNFQNYAFDTAYNAYIDVEVDTSKIDSINSLYSYTRIGNILRFAIGSVIPFKAFSLSYNIKLKANVVIGSLHCHRTRVYPICNLYPSTAYDSSVIVPMIRCLPNDTVELTLRNVGSKNQNDWGTVKTYEDVIIFARDTFKLNVGNSQIFKYRLDTNKVFTAEIFNSNFDPVTPILIRHDDLCTNNKPMITNNPALNFARHDEAKEYEEDCDIVRGSYDPNMKSVIPVGLFSEHYTATGTELKYRIDFQNTGTDTAFRVVLVDTLNDILNIASFVPGISSHPYSVEFGGRAVKFVFDPIALIDSGTNEPASHGYVTFKIKHNVNITPKTRIENKADIYFDYNAPVRTNTVFNTIFDTIQIVVPRAGGSIVDRNDASITVFPNPTSDKFYIRMSEPVYHLLVELYDIHGRMIHQVYSKNNQLIELESTGLQKGIYLIRCMSEDKLIVLKKLVVE